MEPNNEKPTIKRPRVITIPNRTSPAGPKSPSTIKCVTYIPSTVKKDDVDPDEEYEQWYYYHNRPPRELESEHPRYSKNNLETDDKDLDFAIEA